MNTSYRRLLGGLTAAVILLGQSGLVRGASPSPTPIPPPPAGPTGNEMLLVQPPLISVSAKPGSTTTTSLKVRAAADLNLTVRSQGLAQAVDGSFAAVGPDQDTSQYSARSMISFTPESLQIKAGESITINVNVAVPANVGNGTRYAILTITGLPVGPDASANVGFGVELGVSAIVQVADSKQTRQGQIQEISIGKSLPGESLPLAAAFRNTGNSHYGATPNELVSTATLQDAAGVTLAKASASGNQLSVVPTFSRTVSLPMTPSSPLVTGSKYHVEVGVGLEDGTILDRKALDFTWNGGEAVSATAVPIPAPGGTPALSDPTLVILGVVIGLLLVAVLLLLASRRRRRREPDQGAAAK